MRKRLASMLLSIALVVTSVDFTAFATEQDVKNEITTEIQETEEIKEDEEGVQRSTEENKTESVESENNTDDSQFFEEITQTQETIREDDKEESFVSETTSQTEEQTEIQTSSETEKISETETEETSDEETETMTEFITEDIIDDSNIRVTSSNSFGKLLTKSMEEEILELQQTPENNISSITIDGKQATVEFGCAEDATLVVAIYDESGIKMLASGKTEVTIQQVKATVSIDVNHMPDYFLVKGYLVGTDTLKPLSSVYETPMYTREMQELLKKTTDDFDMEKVINLDENKDNNFAVADDNTIVISNTEGENIISEFDNDTQICVITNANEEITSLQVGDIFVYEYKENEILVVKIAGIIIDEQTDGTKTATIYGEETTLEEAFAYLKIDTESELDKAQIDTSETVDGVEYQGLFHDNNTRALIDKDDSISWSVKFTFLDEKSEESDDKLTGDVALGIDFKTKVYLSLSYYYVEIKCDYKFEVGLTISSKNEYVKKELLKKPIGISPVTGVYIEFMPSFVIEASAKISVKGKIKGTVGLALSKDEGLKNISSGPSTEIEVKGEVELFVGISLEPKVKILSDKIAKASMDATVGGVISAKTDPYKDEGSTTHECRSCLDGDISARISIKAEAELNILKKIKVTSPKLEKKYKIRDFYYSFDFNEFAFTVCPHHKYLVKATVLDKNAKPVSNAYVEDGVNLTCYSVDDNGTASFYLPAGKFTLKAYLSEDKSITAEKNITIVDKAKDVKIVFSEFEITDDKDIGVKSVEMNNGTIAAVMRDGRLYTWGQNGRLGALGNGNTQHINKPVNILNNIDSVKLGDTSTVISTDGKLYLWGYNGNGEWNDDASHYKSPRLLMDNVKRVVQSRDLMVITNNNYLYTWYQDDKVDYDRTPIKILENVRNSSNTGGINNIITKNNELYLWKGWERLFDNIEGDTTKNQPIKVMDNVVDFKESVTSVLDSDYDDTYGILSTDGSLYMLGNNVYGQLGNGILGRVEGSANPIKILDNIIDFGTGPSCWALDATGILYTWGDNRTSLLGTGDNNNKTVPTKILENVKEVYDGYSDRMAAVTKNGDLYVWGNNTKGCLGIGNKNEYCNTPTKILGNVKIVVSGNPNCEFGAAITIDGKMYMWGDNANGQLGDGTQITRYSPIKVMDNVKEAYLEYIGTTAVITKDGELYMWGDNTYGQLGNGTNISSSTPVKVSFPQTSSRVKSIDRQKINNLNYSSVNTADINDNTDTNLFDNITYGSRIDGKAVFEELNAGEIYNIYEIKSKEIEDILNSDNLLYIAQTIADENGKISYIYNSKEEYAEFILFAVGNNLSAPVNPQVKNIQDAIIISEPLAYTGQEQIAKIQVTYNDTILIDGVDFELSGNYKAVDVGEYVAEIKGIGDYTGSKTFMWQIHEKQEESSTEFGDILPEDVPSDGNIPTGLWITGVLDDTYKGDTIKPEIRVYDYKKILTEKSDYTIAYKNNINVGQATITVTGKGNYSGKETVAFNILPADISGDDFYAEDFYVKIGQKVQSPIPELYYMGTKLKHKKDFTVKYSNTSGIYAQAGEHTVTVTGIGNYTGTKELKLTAVEKIVKKPSISITKASLIGFEQSFPYTGKACKQECMLFIQTAEGEKQLTEGIDYTIRYINNKKAGTATVLYCGKNGYTGKLKKTFKIMPYDISSDYESKIKYEDLFECVYAKGGSKPSPAITFNGKVMTEGVDYTLRYKNNKEVFGNQTPCVVVNGKGSFKGKVTIFFTINPQDLSKMTLMSSDKVYKNKAGNYKIVPKLMDLDGKLLSAGKDYDKNSITYVYEDAVILENGVSKGAGDVVEDTDIIPAGTQIRITLNCGNSGNYTGTFTGVYRIVKADIKSAKVTIPNQTYTGKEIILDKSQIVVTLFGTTLNPEDYDIIQYTDNVKKGKASVTIKGTGNYGGTKTVKFNIGARGFLWWWK